MEDNIDKKIRINFDKVDEDSQTILVSLSGYVDSYNSKYFQETIIDYIKSGHLKLILNCHGLSYLSSAGIGSFVAISEELKENGYLVLYNVHPKVYEVFSLLGFIKFFNIVDTYEEALQKSQELSLNKGKTILTDIEGKIVFPFSFECKVCGKKLKASKPGKYSCPLCQCSITIDKNGSIGYQ